MSASGSQSSGGYKLKPVAYNPNPPDDDNEEFEDPRQSWQEGDDSESMVSSPSAQAPPKPPKIPTTQRSEGPEKSRLAPQLPPLFQLPPINFDSQPQIQQHDFAYQQPYDSQSAQTVSKSVQTSNRTPQTTSNIHNTSNPILTLPGDSGSLSAQSDPKPGRVSPSRPSISIPTGPRSENNSTETLGVSGSSPNHRQEGLTHTPDEQVGPPEGAVEDSNASFYWHSPQSSTGTTQDGTDEDIAPPQKSSNLVEANFSLSSASALGFGGPSDWEHFGDYDAEEIDDEDLYTSSKPKTAELPATTSPLETPHKQLGGIGVPHDLVKPPMQSTEDEPEQEGQLEAYKPIDGDAEAEIPEDFTTISDTHDSPRSEHYPPPAESPATVLHTDDGSDSGRTGLTKSQTTSKEDLNADTQSKPVTEEQLISAIYHQHLDSKPREVRSVVNNEHQMQTRDVHHEDADINPDVAHGKSEITQPRHNELPRFHEKHESYETQDEPMEPVAPTGNVGAESPNVDVSEGHNPGSGHRGSVDDGAEDIIISLQIPETEPSAPLAEPHQPEEARPMKGPLSASTPQSAHLDPTRQDSLEAGRPERRSIFPKSIEMDDPYANLDPWAKASLNRYVKMLHEESQAERDEDKYMIFMNFIQRETKLRAVLYDIEDDSELPEQSTKHKPLKGSQSILTLRPSIRSKALPALPTDASQRRTGKSKEPPIRLETASRSPGKIDTPSLRKTEDRSKPIATTTPSQEQGFVPQGSSEESYVLVDSPSTEQYTPGGRPVTNNTSNPLKMTPSLTSLRKALDIVAGSGIASDNKSRRPEAPARAATNEVHDMKLAEPGRSNSVPIVNDVGTAGNTTSKVPEKPAYVPFRYNEGRAYEGDKASNRQSIYQPFSELLRQGSQRHTSMDAGDIKLTEQAVEEGIGNDPAAGSNDASRVLGFGNGVMKFPSPIATPDIVPTKRNYRYTILEPLLVVVPSTSVLRPEPQNVIQLRREMDAVPDDFGFIHKTVVAWDAEAKKNRERYEKERHVRQTESEQRIDALFNDNEIGYGDISELEAEFKRSEASKKAEEDRAEFQSFVSKVFDVVWARLHYEMDQLTPLYDTCTQMVVNASAGKEMFEETIDRVPIAPAMDCLLILYQKLGIRHQKAFEAVVERDRRLKKTEVAPWYALGNIAKVKKLEKRFEDAEKKAILEFCRQRDERANLLMDVLDQNTLRGVGSNQDYMESVMQAVRKIAMDVALGGVDDDAAISTDEILKAKTITTALARSSEQIVQTFHVADMLLNAADYEVSVANAKLANADAAAFKRLREAKGKEDQKLVKDLEHRMSLIRGDSSRTHDEIWMLLSLVGGPTGGESLEGREGVVDREREARLKRALEEAKRRNGDLVGGGGGGAGAGGGGGGVV